MRSFQNTPVQTSPRFAPSSRRIRDAVSIDWQFRPINRREPGKSHWLYVLGENIAANYPQQDVVPTIRFKRIEHLGKEAFTFKQSINRVRVTLVPDEDRSLVEVLVCDLPVPSRDSVYKPRYSHTPTVRQTFNFREDAFELMSFCLHHISKDTPYVRDDFEKIQVTYDLASMSDKVFYCGEISKVFLQDNNRWRITMMNGDEVEVDQSTLSGPRPALSYFLAYQNPLQAEVFTTYDRRRFYEYVDLA